MSIRPFLISASVVTTIVLAACSSNDCADNRNSLPIAGFYSSETTPQPVAVSSVSVRGDNAPGDSLLLDNASGVNEVYLPFRITEKSTTFFFTFNDPGIEERVTFNYEIEPRFTSAECGVVYDYRITSIQHTGAVIDSITCPAGVITNTPGQNLRIYLRTTEEQ